MTRADLDALKWKTANIAAGGSFVVPVDKIYEVYLMSPTASGFNLNGSILAMVEANFWYPCCRYRIVDLIDPITGDITATCFDVSSMDSKGWILTDGDTITHFGALAFVVRWRDVTEQQLHT